MNPISRRAAISLLTVFTVSGAAHAVQPSEQLADPAQEARARRLSAELRCLVCQNQSIDDSDAELARDLRRLVRERISAGESDPSIRAFLVARYGEFILLRPPFSIKTALLWTLPALALIGGAWIAAGLFRRRFSSAEPIAQLTEEEHRALGELLNKDPHR
jgi:cytochrome c-type biogenesis protein CcmH